MLSEHEIIRDLGAPIKSFRLYAIEQALTRRPNRALVIALRERLRAEDDDECRVLLEHALAHHSPDENRKQAGEADPDPEFPIRFAAADTAERLNLLDTLRSRVDRLPANFGPCLLAGETHPAVAASIIRLFRRSWPSDNFSDLLTRLTADTGGVRHAALEALIDRWPDGLAAVLPPLLVSDDPRLQALAVQGLARIDQDEAVNHLQAMLLEGGPGERLAGLRVAFLLPFAAVREPLLKFTAAENDLSLLERAGLHFQINPDPQIPYRLWELAEVATGPKQDLLKKIVQGAINAISASGKLREDLNSYRTRLQEWIRRRLATRYVQDCLSRLAEPESHQDLELVGSIRGNLDKPLVREAFREALEWPLPQRVHATLRWILDPASVSTAGTSLASPVSEIPEVSSGEIPDVAAEPVPPVQASEPSTPLSPAPQPATASPQNPAPPPKSAPTSPGRPGTKPPPAGAPPTPPSAPAPVPAASPAASPATFQDALRKGVETSTSSPSPGSGAVNASPLPAAPLPDMAKTSSEPAPKLDPGAFAQLSKEEKIRQMVVWDASHKNVIRPLLAVLLNQETGDPEIRAAGLRTALRLEIDGFTMAATKGLSHADPNLASAALSYLGQFAFDQILPRLGQYVQHRQPRMRAAALKILQREDPAQAIITLLSMLRREEHDSRQQALTCLVHFEFSLVRDGLCELLEHPSGDSLLEPVLCLFEANADPEHLYPLFKVEQRLSGDRRHLAQRARQRMESTLEKAGRLRPEEKEARRKEMEERWSREKAKQAAPTPAYALKVLRPDAAKSGDSTFEKVGVGLFSLFYQLRWLIGAAAGIGFVMFLIAAFSGMSGDPVQKSRYRMQQPVSIQGEIIALVPEQREWKLQAQDATIFIFPVNDVPRSVIKLKNRLEMTVIPIVVRPDGEIVARVQMMVETGPGKPGGEK